MKMTDNTVIPSTLEECTYHNIDRFNFKDKKIRAKCVKVYDGDTITVVFKLVDAFYRFSIRMNGYDSPELRSKDEMEKKYAKLSRDYLKNLIIDKIITLDCKDYDKYGRILADVIIDDVSINELMLKSGYCRKYDGGIKLPWDFSQLEH